MFRELLDLLGDLDADTVTLTASRVHGVLVRLYRAVGDDRALTMEHLLPVAEITTIRDPAFLVSEIKRRWAEGLAEHGVRS
jgi:hypothetical protein